MCTNRLRKALHILLRQSKRGTVVQMQCHLALNVQYDPGRLYRIRFQQAILRSFTGSGLTAAIDSILFPLYDASALLRAK